MSSLNGKTIRVALAGGGSGGHVYPLIAVAGALQEQAQANGFILQLHYYGSNDRFRADIERQGIKFHSLLTGKLRRYASILTVIDVPKIFLGFIQALFKLYALMPDVIFSKGGPGAFPIVLAGWFYKIPVVIHESDSVPGLTTLGSARFAKKIALSFEQTAAYFNPQKVILTGNPIRQELLVNRLSQEEAKRKLGFDPAKRLLFVTGGSQGASKLNEFVVLNLGSILPIAQILHQTGPENFIETKKLAEAELVSLPTSVSTQSRYESLGYLDIEQQRDALSAADMVLARAGSGSIFEASAFGKPIILVPLSSAARDHQNENAQAFVQTGGALVIEEPNLNINIFMAEVQRVLADANLMQGMSQASAAFAKPEAARAIAATVIGLV
jgi:UDP-N-acetylglucosamine--N-acetylmuramyl-(pentapeptide) pyrophosphoryl-undecaprenol N-acetylglucosamine transferase